MSIVRRQNRPLLFLGSRLLLRSRLSRHILIDMGVYKLRFHPCHMSAALWMAAHNPDNAAASAQDLPYSLVRPGDAVVDVGANIGATTLAFWHSVGPSGQVVAIEPHPRTFRYMRENLELNGADNVVALNMAVGAEDGSRTLTDQTAENLNHLSMDGTGIEVSLRRLDGLPEIPDRIALLKIDVEGYERAVLQGAASVLARTDAVYFEAKESHYRRFGYGYAEVHALLREQGFRTFRRVGESNLSEVAPSYVPRKENLLALRDPDAICARLGITLT